MLCLMSLQKNNDPEERRKKLYKIEIISHTAIKYI